MNIQTLESLLSVLSSVGVECVKIAPAEDGEGTLVSGSGTNNNVLVFDVIEDEFSEYPINIQNINALLSRLRLFDTSKASVTFEDNGNGDKSVNRSITIKQGRRKITYHLALKLPVPQFMPDMDVEGDPVQFDKEYTEYLSKAINAVSMTGDKVKRRIRMSSSDEELKVTIFDGEDDSFNDTIEVGADMITFDNFQWNVPAFQKVMKQCVDNHSDGVAEFYVSEQGIALFLMSPVTVMVPPELD
jgi:hypothetical protein